MKPATILCLASLLATACGDSESRGETCVADPKREQPAQAPVAEVRIDGRPVPESVVIGRIEGCDIPFDGGICSNPDDLGGCFNPLNGAAPTLQDVYGPCACVLE